MGEHEVTPEKVHRCIYCTTADRLQNFDTLEPGDHIRVGGRNFTANIFNRQISLYYHHAIVTDVEKLSATSAILHLVSFQGGSYDADVTIREQILGVSLNYDEIYVIRYGTGTSPKQKIIERAQAFLLKGENRRYHLISNNCEHFAHFCCTGVKQSNQIQDVRNSLLEMMRSPVQKFIRITMRFARLSLDDISKVPVKKVFLSQYQTAAILVMVYFGYCIYRQIELCSDLKKGRMCLQCFKERTKDMWLRFLICFSTQAGAAAIIALVISSGLCGGVVVGVTVLLFILSAALIWGIPKLREKLMSPFKGRRIHVKKLTQDLLGNVISFERFGLMHDGIVTNVELNQESDGEKGTLSLVHYSSATKFGQRMIVEEDIEIDLNIMKLKRHDYSGFRVHPSDVVLRRARQRIGETKYGIFSNRSCHFCHWAMINDNEIYEPSLFPIPRRNFIQSFDPRQSVSSYRQVHVDHRENRVQASSTITEREVWIRDEITKGIIVRLKVNGKLHYGIVTTVVRSLDHVYEFIVSLIYKGSGNTLTEEPVEVNLNKEHVWRYTYPTAYQYSPSEIISRARQRLDKQDIGRFERSFKVVRSIAKKLRDTPIQAFTELNPGDVIIFYYWSTRHAAVVSDITDIQTETQQANVTIIHYASNGLFRANTVKEDSVNMNLRSKDILVRSYEGFVTYPNSEVVERARGCIGEQKYSRFKNTSWDLVHWAKVVQKPSIITPVLDCLDENQNTNTDAGNVDKGNESTSRAENTDDIKTNTEVSNIGYTSLESVNIEDSKEYLLLPEAGKLFGLFQRQPVRRWRDLKPGIIVEFRRSVRKSQAILSYSNEETGTITVIYYKNQGLVVDTVVEETIPLDLKCDHIWMYLCDPTKMNKQHVILENARIYMSDKKFVLRSGSWNFCRRCVLKEEYL